MKKIFLLFIFFSVGFSVFAQDDNFTRAWSTYFNYTWLTSIDVDEGGDL